ncbi:YihY/virulence factor BrkB family protein [Antrihabitans stalactiti]|uniref:YihY/virulence factor BrkB family protein n=1 Tax=Antrihabitans stalactiti TaxID=2584121 RepID=A0A848KSR2_9NOCA|nr:YihY/virulence factor BrkB family protein [Antrihabitans stalactiti]NMN99542.1 YihY/virulence factor BrkB family protein [Antrihabitans stalactiti]
MNVAQQLDALQQRHPALSFPIGVLYKFIDDQGVYLAALITYYGFVALFPLLYLLSTVLGFVLAGNPELQQQITESALSHFPVIGDDLNEPARIGGGPLGLVIGVLGSLYGGLGVALAFQNAMNTAWSVPRHLRPNPIVARGQGLLLLGTVGLGILATASISGVGVLASIGGLPRILILFATLVANSILFVIAFKLTTARKLTVAEVAPGAIAAATLWQLLQSFGAIYVAKVVQSASAVNGVFAIVLGLLAFLFLAAAVVVWSVEINVVRVDRLYPRALLAPFTDNVDLAVGDKRAFRDFAQAQRAHLQQDIHVTFDDREEKEPD